MKRSLYFSLALLFFLGCVHAAYPAVINYDFDAPGATTSPQICNQIYNQQDCPGITAHFLGYPIPLGAIDGANGKEIVGYDIICEGVVVVSAGGGGGGDTRIVVRSFGYILVRYK